MIVNQIVINVILERIIPYRTRTIRFFSTTSWLIEGTYHKHTGKQYKNMSPTPYFKEAHSFVCCRILFPCTYITA